MYARAIRKHASQLRKAVSNHLDAHGGIYAAAAMGVLAGSAVTMLIRRPQQVSAVGMVIIVPGDGKKGGIRDDKPPWRE